MRIFLVILLVLSFGCNKTEKNTNPKNKVKKTKVKKTPVKDNEPGKTMQIEGDLGTIDFNAVNKKFVEAKEKVDNCYYKGIENDKTYVGGKFDFLFRIDLQGKVKKLFMKTNIGNRYVEKCIYNFAKNLVFVKPKGGEAKVSFSWTFSPSMETLYWDADKVSFSKVKRKVVKCSDGTDDAPAEYKLVFYVIPGGELASLGISTGKGLVSKKFYKCVLKNVKKLKFPDPLGKVARVDINITP
jgi:hypothetical protein